LHTESRGDHQPHGPHVATRSAKGKSHITALARLSHGFHGSGRGCSLSPGRRPLEDPELERGLAEALEDLRVGDVVSQQEFLRGLATTT
jgi:hypothetical protein